MARSTSVPGRQNETLRKVRAVAAFREAALDNSVIVPTRGRSLTPNAQYRYPARFSPRFAAAAIQLVTEPGGLVIDPFMGSGTTVIEAMRHGRRAVGMDISPISHFLARTTSAAYSDSDLEAVRSWFIGQVSDFRGLKRAPALSEACPRTNLDMRRNWRLVAVIDGIVAQAVQLSSGQQDLARLAVLRSSQWAFDHRRVTPSLSGFLDHLEATMNDLVITMLGLRELVREEWGADYKVGNHRVFRAESTAGLREWRSTSQELGDAIVTSPPYPGVHMLYGRWQVRGRRETSLPLWIVGAADDLREGEYTLHARREATNRTYFELLECVMREARESIRDGAWAVHMVGFKDPHAQLPMYLRILRKSGFDEVKSRRLATRADGRLWRHVPGRRWYAGMNGSGSATRQEVVLLFRAR